MAALSLSQRLTLRTISNAGKFLDPAGPNISLPGYIFGWDKITGTPIIKKDGALMTAKPMYNKGVGKGRSVAVSATPGAF
jgi:hypothetical protein